MIQNKINNLVSIAIFLLYNNILSGHKKMKMVLEMKFQDKTKSERCDCAMPKNDSNCYKERASILEQCNICNVCIFQTSRK